MDNFKMPKGYTRPLTLLVATFLAVAFIALLMSGQKVPTAGQVLGYLAIIHIAGEFARSSFDR